MKEKSIVNDVDIEIKCLLNAISMKYGYEFKDYSQSHLKRRVMHFLSVSDYENPSEIIHNVLENRDFFLEFLLNLSINVTEMFRDPAFYLLVRKEVVPVLKTYPYIKIWHAGCSTGEEVYSMAVLLKEEGLFTKSYIYATDFNQLVLRKAKEGIFPLSEMKKFTSNYQNGGGKCSLSDYCTAGYDSMIMNEELRKKIIFADHNLVTDWVFGEMNMIVCRNVLIYFNRDLQKKVINLFYESLGNRGYLCLGPKESIKDSSRAGDFEIINEKYNIYRKK